MTLHIDSNSTLEELDAAAKMLAKLSNKQETRQEVAHFSEMIRKMVRTLHAPFEVRLGTPDAPPVLVVHPNDRAQGERRRQEAKLMDEWVTAKVQ